MKKLSLSDDVVVLDLRSRKLTDWPAGLERLERVEQVNAYGNQLRVLPESLAQLPRLYRLELSNNPIEELDGDVVARLRSLRDSDLSGTLIRQLPRSLAELELSSVTLTEMPQLDWEQALSIIGRIHTLTALNIGANSLGSLPPTLFDLVGLQRLYLHQCELTELPSAIERLRDLNVLSLHKNKLRDVPDELAALPKLGSLVISGNPGVRKIKGRLTKLGLRVQLS